MLVRVVSTQGSLFHPMTGANIQAPVKEVQHKDLVRVGRSLLTSECPVCKDGTLNMRKNGILLLPDDRCTLCGQAFRYTDVASGSRLGFEGGNEPLN